MSIPLDRLYHYIESIAQEACEDNVIIYRFFPHGSKKIEDLNMLRPCRWMNSAAFPHIYCNDQEPLDYEYYEKNKRPDTYIAKLLSAQGVSGWQNNFCQRPNIYDNNLLLHSEQRSENVNKYLAAQFIPIYYWSHAIIACDWFRYAEYITQKKNIKQTFLAYNRAWSGTREYRLGFADRLIIAGLVDHTLMRISPVDSTLNKHYDLHQFEHPHWRPHNVIEKHFPLCDAESHYSADFDIKDYESTEIEIVLETLFDDLRLHLTEKTLRPIAMGQPFMLAGTYGSLKYLRNYGFKTFANCWDESYDMMSDSLERMNKIVEVMRDIVNWSDSERKIKIARAQKIANYNKKYFFSKKFQRVILAELTANLTQGLVKLETTNSSTLWLNYRKKLAKFLEIKNILTGQSPGLDSTYSVDRKDIAEVVLKARQYYIRSLSNN
jgi:hypothetical protein